MLPRILAWAVFLLLSFFPDGKALCAEKRKPTEYEVKVAHIYNFAKFVDFSTAKFHDGKDTLHVCVLGDDPFGPALTAIEGKIAGNRKILIKRNASPENIRGCEMIFISASEEDHLHQILKAINGMPALTIGDTDGFAEQGVMINFYMDNRTVRFEINQQAAKRAGLLISSYLLKIARLVGKP
jgi:hypothetical protein